MESVLIVEKIILRRFFVMIKNIAKKCLSRYIKGKEKAKGKGKSEEK